MYMRVCVRESVIVRTAIVWVSETHSTGLNVCLSERRRSIVMGPGDGRKHRQHRQQQHFQFDIKHNIFRDLNDPKHIQISVVRFAFVANVPNASAENASNAIRW